MDYQIADPLIKLFKDSTLPQNSYIAEAVRGEVASLQIAMKAGIGTKAHLINPVILTYRLRSCEVLRTYRHYP